MQHKVDILAGQKRNNVLHFSCSDLKTYKVKTDETSGYLDIPLPCRLRYEGLWRTPYGHWAEALFGPHENKKSHHFLHWLQKMIEVARRRGRSVWFMARPLEQGLVSSSVVSLNHWGILVSSQTREQVTSTRKNKTLAREHVWGDLHEVTEHRGKAMYDRVKFTTVDYRHATKFTYIGQTEMTDEDIDKHGTLSNELADEFSTRIHSTESDLPPRG